MTNITKFQINTVIQSQNFYNKIQHLDKDGDGKISKAEFNVGKSLTFDVNEKTYSVSLDGSLKEITGNGLIDVKISGKAVNVFELLSRADGKKDEYIVLDKVYDFSTKTAVNPDYVAKMRAKLHIIPAHIQTEKDWIGWLAKHDDVEKKFVDNDRKFTLEVANYIRTKYMDKPKIETNWWSEDSFVQVCFGDKDGDNIVFSPERLYYVDKTVIRGRGLEGKAGDVYDVKAPSLEDNWYSGDTSFKSVDSLFDPETYKTLGSHYSLYKSLNPTLQKAISTSKMTDINVRALEKDESFIEAYDNYLDLYPKASIKDFAKVIFDDYKQFNEIDSNQNGRIDGLEKAKLSNQVNTNLFNAVNKHNQQVGRENQQQYSQSKNKKTNPESLMSKLRDILGSYTFVLENEEETESSIETQNDDDDIKKKRDFFRRKLLQMSGAQGSSNAVTFVKQDTFKLDPAEDIEGYLETKIWNSHKEELEAVGYELDDINVGVTSALEKPEIRALYQEDPERAKTAINVLVRAAVKVSSIHLENNELDKDQITAEVLTGAITLDRMNVLMKLQSYTKITPPAHPMMSPQKTEVKGITHIDKNPFVLAFVTKSFEENGIYFVGITKESVELAEYLKTKGMNKDTLIKRLLPDNISNAKTLLNEAGIKLPDVVGEDVVVSLYRQNLLRGKRLFETSTKIKKKADIESKMYSGKKIDSINFNAGESQQNIALIKFYVKAISGHNIGVPVPKESAVVRKSQESFVKIR
jgi:hypothetical protein